MKPRDPESCRAMVRDFASAIVMLFFLLGGWWVILTVASCVVDPTR